MSDYAVYVSVLSLIVSAATLYLTQFQRPKISFHVGGTLGFCHTENGFDLYVPITFVNSAQRTGIAQKCAALVHIPSSPAKAYYIEWTEFRGYDAENRKYFRESFAGPIAITGKASEGRIVQFEWRQGQIEFTAGTYKISLFVWLDPSDKPELISTHTGELTEKDAKDLAQFKADKKNSIRYFSIDQQIERNKLLTSHEIGALLGPMDA